MNQKNLSLFVVLTFLLVLGLYAGGFYLYKKYQPTVAGASNTVDFFGKIFGALGGGK